MLTTGAVSVFSHTRSNSYMFNSIIRVIHYPTGKKVSEVSEITKGGNTVDDTSGSHTSGSIKSLYRNIERSRRCKMWESKAGQVKTV